MGGFKDRLRALVCLPRVTDASESILGNIFGNIRAGEVEGRGGSNLILINGLIFSVRVNVP